MCSREAMPDAVGEGEMLFPSSESLNQKVQFNKLWTRQKHVHDNKSPTCAMFCQMSLFADPLCVVMQKLKVLNLNLCSALTAEDAWQRVVPFEKDADQTLVHRLKWGGFKCVTWRNEAKIKPIFFWTALCVEKGWELCERQTSRKHNIKLLWTNTGISYSSFTRILQI